MRAITKEEFLIKKEKFITKINSGSIFIHPTDTIYGLGVNAVSAEAVASLRELKDRYTMPFSVIVPSKEWILQNCYVNEEAKEWINKLPGPYTLILKLKNRNAVSSLVNLNNGTIGVRMPDHWILDIVRELQVPIVTTSANKTGGDFMTHLENLDPDIKNKADFIIYEGEKNGRPSKIIDLTKELRIIER